MRAVVVKRVDQLASDQLVLIDESIPRRVETRLVKRVERRGHGHGSLLVHLEGRLVLEMDGRTEVLVLGEHTSPE